MTSIIVRVLTKLRELADVNWPITNGQLLSYDSTLDKFVGVNPPTGGGVTAPIDLNIADAGTNTSPVVATFEHTTSSTPANNFGARVNFALQSSGVGAAPGRVAGWIRAIWADSDNAGQYGLLQLGARRYGSDQPGLTLGVDYASMDQGTLYMINGDHRLTAFGSGSYGGLGTTYTMLQGNWSGGLLLRGLDVVLHAYASAGKIRMFATPTGGSQQEVLRGDADVSAGDTSLWLLDANSGTMKRVVVGAADSGGSGFRMLRIAN
jgi:hypothetical protein